MTYVSVLLLARPVKCYDVVFSSAEQTTRLQYKVHARQVTGSRTHGELDNPKSSFD